MNTSLLDRLRLIAHSRLLPSLDLFLLAQYVENPDPLDAILDYRQAIRIAKDR